MLMADIREDDCAGDREGERGKNAPVDCFAHSHSFLPTALVRSVRSVGRLSIRLFTRLHVLSCSLNNNISHCIWSCSMCTVHGIVLVHGIHIRFSILLFVISSLSCVLILFFFTYCLLPLCASFSNNGKQHSTHTHTNIHSNEKPDEKKERSKPKCRPAFKMNSVIHSLFHIILPNIRYTIREFYAP